MPSIGWLFVSIVLGGIIIGTFIHKYRYRNWTLIYTAFGHESFFNIVSKLKAGDVKYKVKTPIQNFGVRYYNDNTQYDIYVKKEDAHLAANAMQKGR
jgi:hypothetical protein